MIFLQRTFTSLVHAHAGRTQAENAKQKLAPTLPSELQTAYNNAKKLHEQVEQATSIIQAPEQRLDKAISL